jgi:hypothetical protein
MPAPANPVSITLLNLLWLVALSVVGWRLNFFPVIFLACTFRQPVMLVIFSNPS